MSAAYINKPDEIECTLQFTLKLKDWKQIRETLGSNEAYIELKVINEIRDLVRQMEQTFYVSDTE